MVYLSCILFEIVISIIISDFEAHMKECVVNRIQEGDIEVLDEVLVTIQKLMKK